MGCPPAPPDPPGKSRTADRRTRRRPRRHAAEAAGEERARGRHPLRPQPWTPAPPLPRRRSVGVDNNAAERQAAGPRQEELPLCRLRRRQRTRRGRLHPGRNRQAQPPRPRSPAPRRAHPHILPPDQPHRRPAPLEQTDKAFSTPSERSTGEAPGTRTAAVVDQLSCALFVRFCTVSGALRPSSVT